MVEHLDPVQLHLEALKAWEQMLLAPLPPEPRVFQGLLLVHPMHPMLPPLAESPLRVSLPRLVSTPHLSSRRLPLSAKLARKAKPPRALRKALTPRAKKASR
jgi:hypothetical protein